ncbi:MAG: carbon monoxide dehydrogenase subunit G [Burkholderiales bacterium]|nr:carbon monoxide dehydrogenase subunit G [Burkholderiales bacterium]
MDMQANRQLAVTQQQAWDALNDPVVLKTCIPGCDKVEPTGENQYAIGMALKIGPVAAKFAGKINLSDIKPPSSYNIAFEGQGGVAGFGKGNAQVTLTPNDAGCDLAYVVHASVGGKVAQLGQRLIDGAAKSMAEDFFKRFDDEMQRRFPDAYASKEIAESQDSKTVTGSKGSKIPVWGWVVGVIVVLAILWWLR